MELDLIKLLVNIRSEDTDDLLDRVTAYRAGMESDAIEMIEDELRRRGVNAAKIADHAEACRKECLFDDHGIAKMCSWCRKPAVAEGWGWHKVMGKVPLFPRWLRFCKEHAPPELMPTKNPRPPA